MTGKKFLFYFFLQLLIFTGLKIWFFNNEIFSNPGTQILVYWSIIATVSAALVRRLGVINYLEAFFVVIVWFVADIIIDFLFTATYTGLAIFSTYEFWGGYIVLAVAIVLFHKKQHIHIRKMLHAHHHAHH